MKQSNKFSPEVRGRAVWMERAHRGHYLSLWAAIESIAPKIGGVAQPLPDWVKQAEVEACARTRTATTEQDRFKALEREVKGLRRANEILKLASAFFVQAERDRRTARSSG